MRGTGARPWRGAREAIVGRRDVVVVHGVPTSLMATIANAGVDSDVHETLASVEVYVLARALRGQPAGAAVPSGDEPTEAAHGHVVLVETKAAHGSGVGLCRRTAAVVRVRPEKGSPGDFQTRAAALLGSATVGHPRATRTATRRLGRVAPVGTLAGHAAIDNRAALGRCGLCNGVPRGRLVSALGIPTVTARRTCSCRLRRSSRNFRCRRGRRRTAGGASCCTERASSSRRLGRRGSP